MDHRQKIVEAAEKALIELDKVIRQKIDLNILINIKTSNMGTMKI